MAAWELRILTFSNSYGLRSAELQRQRVLSDGVRRDASSLILTETDKEGFEAEPRRP
jgi:hypothetical protein